VLPRLKTLWQSAALPYIWGPAGVEVALITSKERKRWIVPKGWPEKGQAPPATAAMEAIEEAGISGVVSKEPIGSFTYDKQLDKGYSVPCRVYVYPLLACEQRLAWKEQKQRRILWLPLKEAAGLADDRGLAALLTRLCKAHHVLADLDHAFRGVSRP